MVRAVFPFLLMLAACGKGDASAAPPPSACQAQMFEESRFTVCGAGKGRIELVAAGRGEHAIRRLADLEASLGARAGTVAFAMSAGMYDEDGRPSGWRSSKGNRSAPSTGARAAATSI